MERAWRVSHAARTRLPCTHANTPTRQKVLAIATSREAEHVQNAMLMVLDLQSGICYTLLHQLSAHQSSPLSLLSVGIGVHRQRHQRYAEHDLTWDCSNVMQQSFHLILTTGIHSLGAALEVFAPCFFFARTSPAGAPVFPHTQPIDYGSIDIPIMPGNAGRRARHMHGCGRFYMDRRICPNCGATVYQFSGHAVQTCRTCKYNFIWRSEPEVVPAKPPPPRPLGQSDLTFDVPYWG